MEYDSDEEDLLCESCKYPDPEKCYTCKQKTKNLQYVHEGNTIFPLCETCKQGSQYSSEESASNSEEDEDQRIEESTYDHRKSTCTSDECYINSDVCYICGEETEELVHDSEEDEDICETCMQTQETEESPLNSEESASNSEDDEDICTACLQLR